MTVEASTAAETSSRAQSCGVEDGVAKLSQTAGNSRFVRPNNPIATPEGTRQID